MALYAGTIFVSAFLLFQVQPMIGKRILPWFGSSPAVWTTCMLFFQVLLLVGYAYAHGVRRLPQRWQGVLHVVLLVAALLFLPLAPRPPEQLEAENPTWQILLLLGGCVGVPYALLSSTGPLMQAWFSSTHPGRSPYRLYALSNVGSLLALLSYPVVFERFMAVNQQIWMWSMGFGLFAALAAACAVRLLKHAVTSTIPVGEPVPSPQEKKKDAPEAPPRWIDRTLWLLLAMCGSVMLLATTNQLCQDVAVVPFLWVAPLSLYLLTFIIAFDNERWYHRGVFLPLLFVAIGGVIWAMFWGVAAPLWFQALAHSLGVFSVCMACHGEMARMKPSAQHLTLYFFVVSLGGALGGVFVAILAPQVFRDYWELHLALGGAAILVTVVVARDEWRQRFQFYKDWKWGETFENSVGSPSLGTAWKKPEWWFPTWLSLAGLGVSAVWGGLCWKLFENRDHVKAVERDFYGVLSVERHWDFPKKPDGTVTGDIRYRLSLVHGRIMHGFQYEKEPEKFWNTSYYGRYSGIATAIEEHPARDLPAKPLRVGVVGLGTGTIAALARKNDYFRFYDINPHLVEFSGRIFSYLSDAEDRGADVGTFLGDARMVMERQLENDEAQQFDVLAIDAFSSDAIPLHLLTRECFEIYHQHLKPDGVLAVHVSNRFLELKPVVRELARHLGCDCLWIDAPDDDEKGAGSCDWLLVTSSPEMIRRAKLAEYYVPWKPEDPAPILWTDDFSSIYQIVRYK